MVSNAIVKKSVLGRRPTLTKRELDILRAVKTADVEKHWQEIVEAQLDGRVKPSGDGRWTVQDPYGITWPDLELFQVWYYLTLDFKYP